MPRNSSGVYTLPQTAFVTLTTISSSAMNSNLSDIATALTGSLAVNGSSVMTAPLVAADGTSLLPSVTFVGALTSGLYVAGTNQVGMTANAIASQTWNNDGSSSFISNVTIGGTLTMTEGYGAISATTITASGAITGSTTLGLTGVATVGGLRCNKESSGSTQGLGYTTGAGGNVTQLTSKSTAVTMGGFCGQITTVNSSLASVTTVSFTLSMLALQAIDTVIANAASGFATPGSYLIWADTITGGTCSINIRNLTGGTLSEAIVINVAIIKGAVN